MDPKKRNQSLTLIQTLSKQLHREMHKSATLLALNIIRMPLLNHVLRKSRGIQETQSLIYAANSHRNISRMILVVDTGGFYAPILSGLFIGHTTPALCCFILAMAWGRTGKVLATHTEISTCAATWCALSKLNLACSSGSRTRSHGPTFYINLHEAKTPLSKPNPWASTPSHRPHETTDCVSVETQKMFWYRNLP